MTVITTRQAGPFSYDDLEDEPSDGYRREIIGGTLIVTPAPSGGHQRASTQLAAALLAAETPDTLVLAAPFDWHHPDGGVVQPDLIVLRRSDFDRHGPLPPTATPMLVVEILSPSNPQYDLAVKRALYERLGVPAYWIVDPDAPSIVALHLIDGRYVIESEVHGDEELTAEWPFPVRFRATDLQS